jgi:ferritin-like metal-binding protein YciE
MRLENLEDVFHHELKDLYSAETMLLDALPAMADAAHSDELRAAVEHHHEETREHVRRLEEIADTIGLEIEGETCEAMEGLIQEGEELLEDNDSGEALDAAMIAAAQRIEHYEIAAYGSAATFANELGHEDAARLLGTTLDEEKATDKKLTAIAESRVNERAMKP